jgi:hypothetical protein
MYSGSKDGMNYYEVLEVPHDAPQHEIHKAFQRAKATYGQDNPALYSMFSREEARDLMKLVDEAYAVLGNHSLRRNYDDMLLKAGLRSLAPSMVAKKSKSEPSRVPELQHESLPDFVVPDPSIPGSFDEVPTYVNDSQLTNSNPVSPIPISSAASYLQATVNIQVNPPTPSMDPLHANATGIRESILVTNSEFTVRKRESATPLPADTGRCPLGTYKIDLLMEQEIATATEFDGLFLQKIRMYKQVSLEKLSVSSRIGKTYLIALESNDFKNLPAPVFLRGFLVQIAKQLGLDEQKVVTNYMNLAKAGHPSKYGP